MSLNFDLSVSVVLYKTNIDMLNRVIKSLSSDDKIKIKLFLVDNSPVKFDLDKLIKSKNVAVDYIFNNANVGFGKAHNIAMVKSLDITKYHLVLNPDVFFDSSVLQNLINFMDSHKNIGLVMPKVLYPDGNIQYLCKLLPTPAILFLRRFPLCGLLMRKKIENYELRFTGYNKTMKVPSLSGCFMFIRTEVLKAVGLFDDRFFMYLEDVDLVRRIGKVSDTVFYPEVSIFHDYAKGSYKNKKLLYYHISSAFKYFNKWGWFFDRERKKINKVVTVQFET